MKKRVRKCVRCGRELLRDLSKRSPHTRRIAACDPDTLHGGYHCSLVAQGRAAGLAEGAELAKCWVRNDFSDLDNHIAQLVADARGLLRTRP